MNNSTFYAVCSRMSTFLASCLSGQGGPPSAWGTLHIKACVPLLAARKHAHDPYTILRMVGRHHSRNYAHPYAPGGFIHLYIYMYTHTHTHVLHAETRKETGGSRDPLLPSTSLSIRTSIETRDDIPFSAPPSLEYIDPRGRKGIEIDPALARIRIACWRLSGRMVG